MAENDDHSPEYFEAAATAKENNRAVMALEGAAARLVAAFPGTDATIILTGRGEKPGALPVTHFTTTAGNLRIATILRAALRKLGAA